jgi:hypothetical protein
VVVAVADRDYSGRSHIYDHDLLRLSQRVSPLSLCIPRC